ncbi:MAG TPA: PHB depolymerase family esterase [Pirellulales bacterium]|jgi:predicted esterase|nr:PHB depolymerase family esterase [Pirellulales bacterium]
MHTLFVTAMMLLGVGEPSPELVALFTSKEFQYTGGRHHEQAVKYRLFDPRTREDDERPFPLIVWLHGAGDRDNSLRWMGSLMPSPWERDRFPFFVLVVQCLPHDRPWSAEDAALSDDMLTIVAAILDDVSDRYPIDHDRVSLVGISAGADGSWIFASRRPDYFSAVAPLSAAAFPPTPTRIAALKQMRIWAFNCRNDKGCPIEPIRDSIAALVEAGVNVHLSEIETGPNHDSWSGAFGDYALGDWLIAQRRGDSSQLRQEIIAPGRETVGFIRAFFRGTLVDFFHDLFQRWDWHQFPMVVYMALVAAVVGRWTIKHVRIVRRKRRRPTSAGVETINPESLGGPIA